MLTLAHTHTTQGTCSTVAVAVRPPSTGGFPSLIPRQQFGMEHYGADT